MLLQTLQDAFPPNKQLYNNSDIQEKLQLLKKVKCEIDQNLARCIVCCYEEEQTDTLLLKKVENKWLVNMKKENLQIK